MTQRRIPNESERAKVRELREPSLAGPDLTQDELATIANAVKVIDDPNDQAIAWDILTRYKATFDYLKDR